MSKYSVNTSKLQLLVFLYLFAVYPVSISKIIVHLNNNGHDRPLCMKGKGACHSLDYVLSHVKKNSILQVMVGHGNHGLKQGSSYDLQQSSISFIGTTPTNLITECSVRIKVEEWFDYTKVTINNFQKLAFSNICWTLRLAYPIEIADGDSVVLNHNLIAAPAFHLRKIKLVNISNSLFNLKNSFISRVHYQQNKGMSFVNAHTVFFRNCTFINGSYMNPVLPPLVFNMVLESVSSYKVTIEDSKFQNIRFSSSIIRIANAHIIILKNCIFTDIGSDDNTLMVLNFSSKNVINIKDCTFQHIVSRSNSYLRSSQIEINNTTFNHCTYYNKFLFFYKQAIPKNWTRISITNSVFSNNIIQQLHDSSSLIHQKTCVEQELLLTNVTFTNNVGTPIYTGFPLTLYNVSFLYNTGLRARGIVIDMPCTYNVTSISRLHNVVFHENKHTAVAGGGIYFDHISELLLPEKVYTSSIQFHDENQGIFSFYPEFMKKLFPNISRKYLMTSAAHIQLSNLSFVVYPGKRIIIPSLSVTDYFGNDAKCTAMLSMNKTNGLVGCNISLTNEAVQLYTSDMISMSSLLTTTDECLKKPIEIEVTTHCTSIQPYQNPHSRNKKQKSFNTTGSFSVILKDCPLGYRFCSSSEICQPIANTSDLIAYNDKHINTTVCIPNNYWFGQNNAPNAFTLVPCTLPYCDTINSRSCSIDGYTTTHQQLPWTQDEQCIGLYGGVLCRSCKKEAVFTFGATKCVPMSDCKELYSYLIIGLAIVSQIVLSMIIICSRPKTKSGVGYLYGPLFFLAVYKLLPISHTYLHTDSPLEIIFSVYETLLLVNLDIFGKLPWCFFPNLDQMINYCFRLAGPSITFSLLLVVVFLARSNLYYKFKINRMMHSPIQPICLLLILSFWSLSKTSIEIIKPIEIDGEWKFSIQPEYTYLGNAYVIALFCFSICLLLFVYIPFILLLVSSQWLRAKINMARFKPFLDAFQSSYHDNYHWYSGVYLTSWLILNINMPSYVFVIILSAVGALHFVIQPYKNRFMNICDTLLLVDLIILALLSANSTESSQHIKTIIVYVLVISPLLYMLIGGIWIIVGNSVVRKLKYMYHQYHQKHKHIIDYAELNETIIDSGDKDIHEQLRSTQEMKREPLIFDDND